MDNNTRWPGYLYVEYVFTLHLNAQFSKWINEKKLKQTCGIQFFFYITRCELQYRHPFYYRCYDVVMDKVVLGI